MKKLLSIGISLLLVSATAATTAARPAKRKAVPATLYLHGSDRIDDVPLVTLSPGAMDTKKPSESTPASRQYINYIAGPRQDCVNGYVFSPVWYGKVAGRIVGNMKVTFFSASSEGSVTLAIYADDSEYKCGDSKHQPLYRTWVDIPTGAEKVTATIKHINLPVQGMLAFEITPNAPTPPFVGRMLYDAKDYASKIRFSCIPARGRSCTS